MELYVSDLRRSSEFWGWILGTLGYKPFQEWEYGRSWILDGFYVVLAQVGPEHGQHAYDRRRVGLNHIAFAGSRKQVDEITNSLKDKGETVLYEDRHPFAGGPDHYAVYFQDPDGIKIEIVAAT